MSFHMSVKEEKILEDGTYAAVLHSVEQIETKFGESLIWRFHLPSENVEVAGFTSVNESTKAKAYAWAASIMGQIDPKIGWGPEDVEGKACTVILEVSEDAQGVERNRVVKVRPPKTQAEPQSPHFE